MQGLGQGYDLGLDQGKCRNGGEATTLNIDAAAEALAVGQTALDLADGRPACPSGPGSEVLPRFTGRHEQRVESVAQATKP